MLCRGTSRSSQTLLNVNIRSKIGIKTTGLFNITMNIILNINDLSNPESELEKNRVHFLEKKRNIIMDGVFTKIIFSDEFITMNGLYINCLMQFQNSNDKNNKNIVYFQPYHTLNVFLIKSFSEIEKQILEYYKDYYVCIKTPVYSLHNQLYSGNAKIYKSFNSSEYMSPPPGFSQINKKYVIKISGVWETDRNVGITYKFLELKSARNKNLMFEK